MEIVITLDHPVIMKLNESTPITNGGPGILPLSANVSSELLIYSRDYARDSGSCL